MARNQVWDSEGNLIEDIEIEDVILEPTSEERLAAIEAAMLDFMGV